MKISEMTYKQILEEIELIKFQKSTYRHFVSFSDANEGFSFKALEKRLNALIKAKKTFER